MERSTPPPAPVDAVRALFAERGRHWETHDALLADLARRCHLDLRAAGHAIERLLANGDLDAITLCHPAEAGQMVVESAYQPGPRLRLSRCGEVA